MAGGSARDSRALAQCSTYGNSLLGFTAGQVKTCPLRIGFDAGTKHQAIVMESDWRSERTLPGNGRRHGDVHSSTGSAPCSQWKLTPSGTYTAPDGSVKYRNVSRLPEFDSRGNVVADHGNVCMSFSILITK